jgi:hypothetical protein
MSWWDTTCIVLLSFGHCRDLQYHTHNYIIRVLDVVRRCDIASADDFKVIRNFEQRVVFHDGNCPSFCCCSVVDYWIVLVVMLLNANDDHGREVGRHTFTLDDGRGNSCGDHG